jgi:hypothetical protein
MAEHLGDVVATDLRRRWARFLAADGQVTVGTDALVAFVESGNVEPVLCADQKLFAVALVAEPH